MMNLTSDPITNPTNMKTPEPDAVLVSENVGGIFAYLNDYDQACELAATLNESEGVDPDEEEQTFYVLDFDPDDHALDFMETLHEGNLVELYKEGVHIGYAIGQNSETAKLLAQ